MATRALTNVVCFGLFANLALHAGGQDPTPNLLPTRSPVPVENPYCVPIGPVLPGGGIALVGGTQYAPKTSGKTQKLPSVAEPESVASLMKLAFDHEKAGHPWLAINAYRKALDLEPNNRVVLLSYARMKHRGGDLDGAKILYRQLLADNPQDPVTLNDVALCHARLGEFADAESALRSAIAIQPKNKRYRNNLATILVQGGKIQPAYELLEETFGPAVAHYNLGWLLQRENKTHEAVVHLRQALDLDPSFGPAKDLLTRIEPEALRLARREEFLPVTAGDTHALWSPETPGILKIAPQSGLEEVEEEDLSSGAAHGETLNGGSSDLETTGSDSHGSDSQDGTIPPAVEDYPIPGVEEFLLETP